MNFDTKWEDRIVDGFINPKDLSFVWSQRLDQPSTSSWGKPVCQQRWRVNALFYEGLLKHILNGRLGWGKHVSRLNGKTFDTKQPMQSLTRIRYYYSSSAANLIKTSMTETSQRKPCSQRGIREFALVGRAVRKTRQFYLFHYILRIITILSCCSFQESQYESMPRK